MGDGLSGKEIREVVETLIAIKVSVKRDFSSFIELFPVIPVDAIIIARVRFRGKYGSRCSSGRTGVLAIAKIQLEPTRRCYGAA